MKRKTICPECGYYDGPNLNFIRSSDVCPECECRLANITIYE